MSAKRSTKKLRIATRMKNPGAKTSEEKTIGSSFVVTKPKIPIIVPFGTSNHVFNPSNPKSRNIATRIKKAITANALSAQAEASIFKDDLAERIPREEVAEHIKFIETIAQTTMPAGSFRRGSATCNDIDIVIREPIGAVVARLTELGYIKHTFSAGGHKFSGIVKHPAYPMHRHLDIVMTTESAYPFAMLYFTGSAKHNIIMRLKAKRLGLRLNEYGLFRGDDQLPGITTERDIFAALGVGIQGAK